MTTAADDDVWFDSVIASTLCFVFLLSFSASSLAASNSVLKMVTRYWDEIDWYIKEGTDKLAEILHLGSEEESLKKDIDTTVSTDQSTRLLPTKETNESPLVSEDENESKVSDEEETSIPDDETDQKVSDCHVAKLLDWCKSHGLYPPVYTYCDAEQYKGKLLCTVRLWNGLSFQSSAQFSRDEAMEDAASLALPHLENEAHVATVSSSPKQNAYNTPHVQQGVLLSYPSYCVKDFTSPSHNLQYTHQDGKVIAPRPYVVPPNPFVVPAPAQPYPNVHPAMVNNFMQMAPPVLNQPYPVSYPQRYYSIPGAGVYTTPFIPPVLPPYAFTTAALPNPIYYQTSTVTQNSENFAANSNSRLSATTNPFIPSQVKYSRSSDSATTSGCLSISRFETTGSPNYVLSDTPPTSVRSVSAATVNTSVQGPKTSKPKPKLAISFVKPSD